MVSFDPGNGPEGKRPDPDDISNPELRRALRATPEGDLPSGF
jgi:hypothetical protein